jgi:DNA replication protein DnaC
VLVLDELRYLPLVPGFGPLLYEIVAGRYERKPIIITSNKSLIEWSSITQDVSLAAAIADRLFLQCTLYVRSHFWRLHT